MIINMNKNIFIKKMYVIFVTNLKTLNKKTYFLFFHIIISCIMFSNESENKLFWNQIIFQNIKKIMMYLYFFNINNNYKNHIFFNLTDKI